MSVPVRLVDIALVCPCKFTPGAAYVAFAGGRLYALYLGCVTCGICNIIHAEDDRAHGPQVMSATKDAVHHLHPGFKCCACGVKQWVGDRRIVRA